jgi:hypothetical protein
MNSVLQLGCDLREHLSQQLVQVVPIIQNAVCYLLCPWEFYHLGDLSPMYIFLGKFSSCLQILFLAFKLHWHILPLEYFDCCSYWWAFAWVARKSKVWSETELV